MKISITRSPSFITDYINICPLLGHHLQNFDNLVGNNQCTEILANNIINHIAHHNIEATLKYWVSKLRKNGQIIIDGTDARLVNFHFMNGDISVAQLNMLLFGRFSTPWDIQSGLYTNAFIKDLLVKNGLKILKVELIDYSFLIKAQR